MGVIVERLKYLSSISSWWITKRNVYECFILFLHGQQKGRKLRTLGLLDLGQGYVCMYGIRGHDG